MLQVWLSVGSQAVDQGAHPPRVSGVGAQAADWGAHHNKIILKIISDLNDEKNTLLWRSGERVFQGEG